MKTLLVHVVARPLIVLILVPTLAVTSRLSPVLAAPIPSVVRFTAPQSLVLHAHDLPSVFGSGFRESGAPVSNAEVAAIEHVSTATIDKHGRLAGYLTTLTKVKNNAALLILDSVGAYRSSADAHWEYDKFLSVTPVPTHSVMISMSGVASEARAYLHSLVHGSVHENSASVYFRQGAYNGRIDITDQASLRTADVQALARVLNARLRKAH